MSYQYMQPNQTPYGVPYQPMKPRNTSRTGPIVLLCFGIAMLLGAVGAIVLAGTSAEMFVDEASAMDQEDSGGPNALGEVGIPVKLDARVGTRYALYPEPVVGVDSVISPDQITVVGPDGIVACSETEAVASTSKSGSDKDVICEFTASTTGLYEISLAQNDELQGQKFSVESTEQIGKVTVGFMGMIGGLLIAGLCGIIGIGLTFGGGLWLLSRVRNAAQARR